MAAGARGYWRRYGVEGSVRANIWLTIHGRVPGLFPADLHR